MSFLIIGDIINDCYFMKQINIINIKYKYNKLQTDVWLLSIQVTLIIFVFSYAYNLFSSNKIFIGGIAKEITESK